MVQVTDCLRQETAFLVYCSPIIITASPGQPYGRVVKSADFTLALKLVSHWHANFVTVLRILLPTLKASHDIYVSVVRIFMCRLEKKYGNTSQLSGKKKKIFVVRTKATILRMSCDTLTNVS